MRNCVGKFGPRKFARVIELVRIVHRRNAGFALHGRETLLEIFVIQLTTNKIGDMIFAEAYSKGMPSKATCSG